MQTPSRSASFITGIDHNYFLLAGMLLESLDRHFPAIPVKVMDFGLTDAQQAFFRSKGLLLEMPAGLARGDHPYKFKSRMGDFLGPDFGVPVWLDADIIATGDGTAQLRAIAPDQGPCVTLADFPRVHNGPHLADAIRAEPALGACRYLNVGVVFFRAGEALAEWGALTPSFEGDMCWEQNAFNVLCHRDPAQVLVLDGRAWNMHGALLDRVRGERGNIRCEGEPVFFAHAASSDGGHLTWGEMDFEFDGCPYKNFIKFFTNGALRDMQEEHLSNFLSNNLGLLKETGVLVRRA